ncbi:MAG: hypothetical protein PW843_15230 [Azospirillaceae bacterium]|nr:hypothetical protein [Azospirillaceae bacterium]
MAFAPLAHQMLPASLQNAATVHNRLVDAFIQMTRAELARQRDDYARDSLNELLDLLKNQLALAPDLLEPSLVRMVPVNQP